MEKKIVREHDRDESVGRFVFHATDDNDCWFGRNFMLMIVHANVAALQARKTKTFTG